MYEGLLAAFIVNLFAELGDKTQLAVIALSAKYRKPWQILAGSMAGFALATAVAVLVGGTLSQIIPATALKIAAALLFIVFGTYVFFSNDAKEEAKVEKGKGAMLSSFALIFVMELGDKTQFANAALSATNSQVEVFIGALLALGLLTSAAIAIGKQVSRRLPMRTIKALSAAAFLFTGLLLLLR